ncbi:DUF3307 domain-containing protein [Desulfatibacillum aliphaticivorans]|uniref:DUF3307 domain-containing protein n=1 Tax=Desulfatibacillum aliphaticivorans TaxID=218208 RepID=UPI0005C17DF4
MTLPPLIYLIISHIIGDLVISFHRLAVMKRDPWIIRQAGGIGIHCMFHAVAAGILLSLVGYSGFKGALLVFGTHFTIDFARCKIEMRVWGAGKTYQTIGSLIFSGENPIVRDPKGFLIWGCMLATDQIAHLSCLICISKIV